MQGEKSEGYSGVKRTDDIGLEQDGDSEDAEMWMGLRSILCLEWLAPSDEVAMGDEGEAVVESTPSFPVETTKWLMGPSLHWGLLRANTM